MIANKRASRLAALLMALAVCLCALAQGFSGSLAEAAGGEGVSMEYEVKLFDTSAPISVDIQIDEDDWQGLLDNAADEEYAACDVKINGETFSNVGIRTKGNTSLSSIVSDPTTDRYSFKLEFDHYVDGQTCYGLDKLILNNNYADATNMKEALVYDMFAFLGADASLYNYARVSVNGEYWGVYLALEAVEESFLLRNYGVNYGSLYKPDSMNMGGGGDDSAPGGMPDMGDFNPGNAPDRGDFDPNSMPEGGDFDPDSMPEGRDFDPGSMPDMGGQTDAQSDEGSLSAGRGGFSMGSGGANLSYTDDDLDSYSTIWEGEVTDTSKKDHQRVVSALKSVSEGENLEEVMDIDNLLRYMAVHIFSVNDDSLSGSMAHNYYLYEKNGRLNLIPWDYNLAFGGMQGDSETSMVNDPIDNAFSATDFFDTLLAEDEYLLAYHESLSRLVSEYVNGGGLDAFYERTRSQIDQLVQDDPTAFYTYDEYDQAAQTLYDLVKLRAQSIEAQLDGRIASTQSERSDADELIDASAYSLQVMGSMGGGRGGMQQPGDRQDNSASQSGMQQPGDKPDDSTRQGDTQPGDKPDDSTRQGDTQPSDKPDDSTRQGGIQPGDKPDDSTRQGDTQQPTGKPDSTDGQSDTDEAASPQEQRDGERNSARRGDFTPPDGAQAIGTGTNEGLLIYGGCMLLMLAALLFVRWFRRAG